MTTGGGDVSGSTTAVPGPGTGSADRAVLPGIGWGLLAAVSFGSSGVIARPLLQVGWTSGAVVLVRIGLAAVVLLAPALMTLRGRWYLLRRKAGLLTAFGVFAVAAAQVCYFYAVQYVSIGVALLLEYSGIVLVVGWTWLRTRVRPSTLTMAGAAVAIAGLALVLDAFGDLQVSAIGVLWGLGAAVGLAVFYMLSARTEDGLPSLVVVTAGMVVGTVGLALAGLVGILPMTFVLADVELSGLTMSWLAPVLWLGLVTAAVAYLTGVLASRRLGSTMASFFGLTEVLFAVLLAWWLAAEVPAAVQLVGGVLVLTGVALVRLGELRPRTRRAALADLAPG